MLVRLRSTDTPVLASSAAWPATIEFSRMKQLPKSRIWSYLNWVPPGFNRIGANKIEKSRLSMIHEFIRVNSCHFMSNILISPWWSYSGCARSIAIPHQHLPLSPSLLLLVLESQGALSPPIRIGNLSTIVPWLSMMLTLEIDQCWKMCGDISMEKEFLHVLFLDDPPTIKHGDCP